MYEYTSEDIEVINQFHGRCILCKRKWFAIHEMETRGAVGQKAMQKENRVTLCQEHHNWVHSVGSLIANPILILYRDRVLEND